MNRERWSAKGQRRYEYAPGLMDRCDPNVIAGTPLGIAPGSIVVVTKRIGRALVWILDANGNEQSVWRAALVPLKVVRRGRHTYYAEA